MIDDQIVRKFAARVLDLYASNGCMDIDGLDMYAVVEECGFVEEGHVTKEDLEDDWVLDCGFEIGEEFDRWTDLAKKLMKEGAE